MEKIKTLEELKQAILLLEIQKIRCELKVRQELEKAGENLSPVNLLKRQLDKWLMGSDITKSLIDAGITAAAGFASKKLAHTSESHPIRKLLGSFLRLGPKPQPPSPDAATK